MDTKSVEKNSGSKLSASRGTSSSDKRYIVQIEKALATFSSLEEWADYITYLSRLLRALSLPEKSRSVLWIPLHEKVSNKLALCLSPTLPSGVHQKTLELYASIFDALTLKELNRLVPAWLPGLLLVLSYGSTQVKPQLLALYEHKLIEHLDKLTLRVVTRPLILSLLPGLDDENSEIYSDCLRVLERFKERLDQNSHFWQNLFLCIISSPEKRIGALNWCLSHLPVFSTIQLGSDEVFSSEAQSCLGDKGGLLIRAFASALNTSTSFNPATDIIVVRGFFDLLLARLPLNSRVLTSVCSETDKQLLIMACVKTTLRKEMSLNRRLWTWLLGPNSSYEGLEPKARKEFFSKHALLYVKSGLLALLNSPILKDRLSALKMSLSLIIDKWEISQLVTPLVFETILRTCEAAVREDLDGFQEILQDTKLFFNQVETAFIWRYISCDLMQLKIESDQELLLFILKTFDLPDEASFEHVHLAILTCLLSFDLNQKSISTLESLVSLAKPELLPAYELDSTHPYDKSEIIRLVKEYYDVLSTDENGELPLSGEKITFIILHELKSLYGNQLLSSLYGLRLASILSEFVYAVPYSEDQMDVSDTELVKSLLDLDHRPLVKSDLLDDTCVFGIYKLHRYFLTKMTKDQKLEFLRLITYHFWTILVSDYPARNQVESVKAIFDLSSSYHEGEVEAGIVSMILSSSTQDSRNAFKTLWIHSVDLYDPYCLLINPLFIILDGLERSSSDKFRETNKFLYSAYKDNTIGRLYHIVTVPILYFMRSKNGSHLVTANDDMGLLHYHVRTLKNLIASNRKVMKHVLGHEFVGTDTLSKCQEISGSWRITNYKSLVLNIAVYLIQLEFNICDTVDMQEKAEYSECVANALGILELCIDGSETNFDALFCSIIDSCLLQIQDSRDSNKNFRNSDTILAYLRTVFDILQTTKLMNVSLSYANKAEHDTECKLATFMTKVFVVCDSASLLEAWFKLSSSLLHVIKTSALEYLLTLNAIIAAKVCTLFNGLRLFESPSKEANLFELLLILLSGLENSLVISHSHLVRPSTSASTTSAQDGGFLGNVISGVFQIESPYARSEEDKVNILILNCIAQASETAFELWNWADTLLSIVLPSSASRQSVNFWTAKIKLRSKKFLERLCELERQRVIESIIAIAEPIGSKIKVLHVLDSGRTQLSVPCILESIKSQCSPQALVEKDRIFVNSNIKAKQLSTFLPPYLNSIDSDVIDELWDSISKFVRESISHVSQYHSVLLDLLDVMRVIALKMKNRKFNQKDLETMFQSCMNVVLSKRQEIFEASEDGVVGESVFYDRMGSFVTDLKVCLQDQDKITAIISNVINSMIVPKIKSKTDLFDPNVSLLLKAIGETNPVKSWRQVVQDIFMDSSFFSTCRFAENSWKDCVLLWISNDQEKVSELMSRVMPSQQTAKANIFLWNDSSEIQNTILHLRRLSYLIVIQPIDSFGPQLNDLFARIATLWTNTLSVLVQSEILTFLRAVTLKFSDSHLLSHWAFITQSLCDCFALFLAMSTKDLSSLEADSLSLLLSACKLLDQLLLLGLDEFNSCSWLFVSEGSVADEGEPIALIDRLAKKTESLMSKETPILVSRPQKGELSQPLLLGIRELKSTAMLKVFLGLLSYINYERTYDLFDGSTSRCESEVLLDLALSVN